MHSDCCHQYNMTLLCLKILYLKITVTIISNFEHITRHNINFVSLFSRYVLNLSARLYQSFKTAFILQIHVCSIQCTTPRWFFVLRIIIMKTEPDPDRGFSMIWIQTHKFFMIKIIKIIQLKNIKFLWFKNIKYISSNLDQKPSSSPHTFFFQGSRSKVPIKSGSKPEPDSDRFV